eukprot:9627636-Ditylum_brightwellii.AAC.1
MEVEAVEAAEVEDGTKRRRERVMTNEEERRTEAVSPLSAIKQPHQSVQQKSLNLSSGVEPTCHRGAKRLKLWSGLQTLLPSPQSAGGIMNGYLPHRARRGG